MNGERPQIIGLAGSFASGKDTLAKYLGEQFGYLHISSSDMVRAEAMARHGSIERPVLHQTANEIRHSEGAGAFVERALTQAANHPVIVSGLRSIGERDVIKAHGGVVVFVDAPVTVRYERMLSRNRDAETKLSLEQFQANEAGEWYSGDDPADFNLRRIRDEADVLLENTLPLDDFLAQSLRALGLKA